MKKKVLDITNLDCPMTFIKTKLFIKENLNYEKVILVKGKKKMSLCLKTLLRKTFR